MSDILILGATSDIAQAVCYDYAKKGKNLVLTGRTTESLSSLKSDLEIKYSISVSLYSFDGLLYEQHPLFFQTCIKNHDIEGVILAYGYLGDQTKGQQTFQEARQIVETNYVSAVSILELFASYFETKKQGFICGISSVAGDRGRQSNYLYGSSKGAFTLYLQGLRNRLFSSNVSVITVKPGFVKTKMTEGLINDSFLVASPEQVSKDILSAIEKNKSTVYTKWLWKYIMFIIRFIPEFLFKRLKL